MSFPRWLVACLLMLVLVPAARVLAQEDEAAATMAVAEAQHELTSVYDAVLKAEATGTNVSGFIAPMNVAAGFLADAEMHLRTGNFTGAVLSAGQAREILQGLLTEVGDSMEVATFEREQALTWAAALASLGVFLVVVAGWIGWGYVRAFQVRRILKMKPEAVEDDQSR